MNDQVPAKQTAANDPSPRTRPHPMLWLLLVVAVIALAWFFLSQRGRITPAPGAATPTMIKDRNATAVDDNQDQGSTATPADQPATLLQPPRPVYPRDAELAGVEGTVMILAFVDASGDVTDAKIAKRSGSLMLDGAAIREVRHWHFQPATHDGKSVTSVVQVPVQYKLDKQ